MGKYDEIKRQISIVSVAKSLGLTPIKVGGYYTLKEHDSVRIDPKRNLFIRNATGEGGSVIDFVMVFAGKTISEAIQYLTGDVQQEINSAAQVSKKENGSLILPEKDVSMKNVFAYLVQSRGIDAVIVDEMVRRKMLYQDLKKNCVFVSYDNSTPVFGCKRGTNTYKRFIADLPGNDYSHSFFIGNGAVDLIVAEGVIDAMSIMSLLKMDGVDYRRYDYLALAGVAKYEKALSRHLGKERYNTVTLCFDNDEAGNKAAVSAAEYINNNTEQISVKIRMPKEGKDYNDFLRIREGEIF